VVDVTFGGSRAGSDTRKGYSATRCDAGTASPALPELELFLPSFVVRRYSSSFQILSREWFGSHFWDGALPDPEERVGGHCHRLPCSLSDEAGLMAQ